jgi:hypothetical protein
MVLAHLTEHLGQSLTPSQIAHALGGRSTGAIGNALATLVERGQVTAPTRSLAVSPPPRTVAAAPPGGHPPMC